MCEGACEHMWERVGACEGACAAWEGARGACVRKHGERVREGVWSVCGRERECVGGCTWGV